MLDALVGHVVDQAEDEDEDEFESDDDELSSEGLVVLFGLVCESTGESRTRGGDVDDDDDDEFDCLVLPMLGYLVVTLRLLFMGCCCC